jgi:hypothetical protein
MKQFIKIVLLILMCAPTLSGASTSSPQQDPEKIDQEEITDEIEEIDLDDVEEFEQETRKEEPTLTKPKVPEETKKRPLIELEIPYIGIVQLNDSVGGFEGRLADANKKLTIGLLTLDDAVLFLADDGKLKLTARGTLFDKTVRVGLKEFESVANQKGTYSKVTLGIDFDSPPTFDVIPDALSASLTSADIILAKNEPIKLIGRTIIGKKPTTLVFSVDKKIIGLSVTVQNMLIGEIVPTTKGSPLENVALTKINVAVDDVFSSIKDAAGKTAGPTVTIKGNADLTSLLENNRIAGESISGALANVAITLSLNKEKGVHLEGNLSKITVPYIGVLDTAKIIANVDKKDVDIVLDATTLISLEDLGRMPVHLKAAIEKKAITLEGEVLKPINFANVAINKATFLFSQTEKKYILSGDADLYGFAIIVKFIVTPDAPTVVEGSLKNKTIYPFKPFTVQRGPQTPEWLAKAQEDASKEFSTIGFSDATIKISEEGSLNFMGKLHIKEFTFPGELQFHKEGDKEKPQITAIAGVAEDIKKEFLKGSYLESLTLRNIKLIVSDSDVYDGATLQYNKGITLAGEIIFGGILAQVAALTQLPPDATLKFASTVVPGKLDESKIKIIIPTQAKISPTAFIDSFKLEIGNGKPLPIPKMELSTIFHVKPTVKDPELLFSLKGAISPTAISFSGSMEGDWKNPFGIPGPIIKGLGLKIGALPAMPPIVIDQFGLLGHFSLAGKEAILAGEAILPDLLEFGLKAKFDEALNLNTLLAMVLDVTKVKVDASKLPQDLLTLTNVDIKIGTNRITIGNVSYDANLGLEGDFSVFGVKGSLNFNSYELGFEGQGSVAPFDLGPIHVTGSGGKGGPKVAVSLTLFPSFKMSGRLVIDPILNSDTEIRFFAGKFTFLTKSSIVGNNKNIINFVVEAESSIQNPDVSLKILFESNFAEYLMNEVNNGINELRNVYAVKTKEAQKEIAQVKANLDSLTAQINNSQAQINQKNQQIASLQSTINQKTDQTKQSANNKINAAQADVNRLQGRINELNNWFAWYKQLPDITLTIPPTPSKTSEAFTYAGKGIELGALETAKATATGVLDVAKKAANTLIIPIGEETAQITRLGLEIGGLHTAIAGLRTGYDTQKAAYAAKQELVNITANALTAINQKNIISIDRIYAQARAQDFTKGVFPNTTIDYTLLGAKKNLTIILDPNDIEKKIVDLFVTIIRKTLEAK